MGIALYKLGLFVILRKIVDMLSRRVQDMIPIIRKYFSAQPIKKAWLFGSCSRGEEHSDSDVDILVEYDSGTRISLMYISRLTVGLSRLLDRRVDLIEDDCLLPFARSSADKDKILIYERKN